MKLKREVAEASRMKVVMFVSAGIQAVSDNHGRLLDEKHCVGSFCAWWKLEDGSGEGYGHFHDNCSRACCTAFRYEGRERARWDGASDDPDEMAWILDEVKNSVRPSRNGGSRESSGGRKK